MFWFFCKFLIRLFCSNKFNLLSLNMILRKIIPKSTVRRNGKFLFITQARRKSDFVQKLTKSLVFAPYGFLAILGFYFCKNEWFLNFVDSPELLGLACGSGIIHWGVKNNYGKKKIEILDRWSMSSNSKLKQTYE